MNLSRPSRRAAIVAALAALLVTPIVLYAHARLLRSAPASDSRLDHSPSSLDLWFSEKPELKFTVIRLLDSVQTEMKLGPVAALTDGKMGVTVPVTTPLAPGRYTVSWRVAASDGHPTSGKFTFVVMGQAAPPPPAVVAPVSPSAESRAPSTQPSTETPPDGLTNAERWVELMAVVSAIGALALILSAVPRSGWPDSAVREVTDRAKRFAQSALVVAIVASLIRLRSESHMAVDNSMTTVVRDTSWGHGWMVGAAGIVVAGIGLAIAKSTRAGWWIAALGVAAIALGQTITGHSATVSSAGLAIIADWVHLMAAGAWIGGLTMVILAAVPVSRRASDAPLLAFVRAFHRLAVPSVVLVVLCGTLSAWMRLGSLTALYTTRYGVLLCVKVAFFLGVAMLGLYHSRQLTAPAWDEPTSKRFRRTAIVELVGGAMILAVTAALVTTSLP